MRAHSFSWMPGKSIVFKRGYQMHFVNARNVEAIRTWLDHGRDAAFRPAFKVTTELANWIAAQEE